MCGAYLGGKWWGDLPEPIGGGGDRGEVRREGEREKERARERENNKDSL